ncbi:PTS lactose/cellobiose transporter subunit IIA [Pediococcus parvulus]|jgi:PTS system lactose-specific IIA component|uniref:PTS lactose/cellobiose transporter subunit IIA n=1 Tax=Pediococcus parvulus TaxID=54062 RepID=UPI0021A68611|nr:PTS lactose/cellobiose transporter subunit IIA [Pediococcus parvulus]MCT3031702.1 PTS lactose/cellobiose transporter subunit IIA [Pediococcus parvulus]MCT3035809.1 PTS lactose/cellobiose transporter subunit IIA [Pediococcus parvulus]MDN5575698.1 PTS lactose/cellobiose transporter subunit IIA [Pediococcus sp.]
MASREEVSMVGFAIVAYAGDAKTALIKALNEARDGNFEKARKLVEESNQSIVDAHNEQTKLLSQEAGGDDMDVTFIMVHGQDTLMTTMMLKDEVQYFIDEYERLDAIEKKLGIEKSKK